MGTRPASRCTHDPAGRLLSADGPTGPSWFFTDGLGSVIGIGDTDGALAATYRYDPFGVTTEAEGPLAAANPWRYTGAYLDATGLYKLGERYYDPQHGRFTQQDPVVSPADPMHWNRYVYVGNNPINYVDPSGESPWDFAKCMFNEVVGGFADVVGGLRSGPELTSPYAWGAAGVAAGAYVASWGFTWAPAAGAGLAVAGAGLIIYGVAKSVASCT